MLKEQHKRNKSVSPQCCCLRNWHNHTQPLLSHNIILKRKEMKIIKYYEFLETQALCKCKALLL